MTEAALAVIVLAAGEGKRMKSATPKVLHKIGGRPMLAHVLGMAKALGATRTVVVTAKDAAPVTNLVQELSAEAVVQERQLGTGHAVLAAEKTLNGFNGNLLILYGDAPLVTVPTLKRLAAGAGRDGAQLSALGFRAADPKGYGRMVAQGEWLERIVEDKDASAAEKRIDLCFAGPLAGPARTIFDLLHKVGNRNAQGEFYLTDVVALARAASFHCAITEGTEAEMLGVNSRAQLAEAESAFQARRRAELMEQGVSFAAPDTVYLSADTIIEADVNIGPYVVFGSGVAIRSGSEIKAFCHIEDTTIGSGVTIGPFARLRGGAVLDDDVHIGNFVELKNAHLEKGVKASHLTYLGDSHVGEAANIGAGTITCNYDGVNKHRTEIGAGAFIGSNSALVAPVAIGDHAIVAAGSVITDNVESDSFAVARGRQVTKSGGAKKLRAKLGPKKKGA